MKDSARKAMFAKKWDQASGSDDTVSAKLKSDGAITPIPKNLHEFADKKKLVADTKKVIQDEKKVVKDIKEDESTATILKDEKKTIQDTKQVIKDA